MSSQLRAWRIARGWTQQEMADEIGVSRSTLQRLESRKTLPRRYQLALERVQAKSTTRV